MHQTEEVAPWLADLHEQQKQLRAHCARRLTRSLLFSDLQIPLCAHELF